jgi:hypothetical protein
MRPSFDCSSCSGCAAITEKNWPSKSSCSVTRSRFCVARWCALDYGQQTVRFSPG